MQAKATSTTSSKAKEHSDEGCEFSLRGRYSQAGGMIYPLGAITALKKPASGADTFQPIREAFGIVASTNNPIEVGATVENIPSATIPTNGPQRAALGLLGAALSFHFGGLEAGACQWA